MIFIIKPRIKNMKMYPFCSVNLRKSNQNSSCLCIRDLSLGHRRGHSTQTTCPQRHHLQPQKLGSSILPRFAPSSFHSSWHPSSSILFLHPACLCIRRCGIFHVAALLSASGWRPTFKSARHLGI